MISPESEWFKDYFNHDYQSWILETIKEELTLKQVELLERALSLQADSKILDLFCGIGRHAIALAQKDHDVTAIDLVEDYISYIQKIAKDLPNLRSICMDARDIEYLEAFDAIYLMFTSFGYFSDAENEKLIEKIALALKPKGRVLIDLENRDYILQHFIHEKWRNKESGYLLERHTFNPMNSRQKTRRIWVDKDGQSKSYTRNLRLYNAHEILSLAEKSQLKLVYLWGDYNKKPFNVHSPRMIFTFEK
jgi:SAM-dependent methyltransferase